jgi:hypothetical protein
VTIGTLPLGVRLYCEGMRKRWMSRTARDTKDERRRVRRPCERNETRKIVQIANSDGKLDFSTWIWSLELDAEALRTCCTIQLYAGCGTCYLPCDEYGLRITVSASCYHASAYICTSLLFGRDMILIKLHMNINM